MKWSELSNDNIIKEIGKRVKDIRINADISQKELAEKSGIGVQTIFRLEKGRTKITLLNLIAILRALNQLEQFEAFLPEISLAPLSLARSQGKKKIRASRKKDQTNQKSQWSWGDEES